MIGFFVCVLGEAVDQPVVRGNDPQVILASFALVLLGGEPLALGSQPAQINE